MNQPKRTISPGEILNLLRSTERATSSTQTASHLLISLPSDRLLDVSNVAVSDVLTIYQRRLRRARAEESELVIDIEALLSELSAISTASAALVTTAYGQSAASFWFTLQLDRIIGCIAGPDRRESANPS